MLLGEFIKEYRTTHDLSQRDFADLSGISRGYISMLERNENPSTGQPITPTYTIFQKVASCIGISVNDLISSLDEDQLINISSEEKEKPVGRAADELEEELFDLCSRLTPAQKQRQIQILRDILGVQDK